MGTKKDKLDRLRERMQADTNLIRGEGVIDWVFGEGNRERLIYFLGEGPGQAEDEQGRPFVGRAGKLLTSLLSGTGIKREDVYISNVVRFRPPDNHPPTSVEIAAFLPYVDEEISIIQPLLIVTLGRFAMEKFLPTANITQVHGTLQTVPWQGRVVHVFPLYHPAAALRNPQMRQALEADFQKIPSVLAEIAH